MIRHLITSEYPPQPGGVSDYTRTVAAGLASAGDEVHVWCPPTSEPAPVIDAVVVHQELGAFTPRDLRRAGALLDQFPAPRRVLVQWVPHGYGYRSMNLMFCFWLWRRALSGDQIELMVHEPYLSFGEGNWRQNVVAAVHRLMTIVLLRATRRVWISIPAWEAYWRPYTLGRSIKFNWLPVGSNIPVSGDPTTGQGVRAHYLTNGDLMVGHFGSYDPHAAKLLASSVPELMRSETKVTLLLLGHGSERMRSALIGQAPSFASRIHATGSLDADELSRHISACDVMLQPYIDGVSSRRTSTMVALAHGVPVVTTRGRLTEPFWTESDAVALAPVDNIPQFIEITQRLLPDAAARNGMRSAAREFYAEHFDSERTIARLRDVLA